MRRLLLLSLALLPLLPSPGAAQEPPTKTIVIGEGDRLSGRIRIAHLGSAEDDLGRELDHFVRLIRERTDLDITGTHVTTLAYEIPNAELLVSPVDVSLPDANGIDRFRSERGGTAVTIPASEKPTSVLLIEALREAIGNRRAVRHLPTVFDSIHGEVAKGRMRLRIRNCLPGVITTSAITVSGEEIAPESEKRSLDLDSIPDWEDAIVRIRWRGGGGLADEARVWLPDLAPELAPTVEVLGAETAYVGLPWRCRVLVRGGRRPVPGVEVVAKLGDRELRGMTDPAGSAVFEFPPFETVGDGQAQLRVTVEGPRISRRLTDFIAVAPPKITARLSTDRPVHRPGSQVKLRAVVTDSYRRHGLAGQALTLRLLDPRGRMLVTAEATTGSRGVATFEVPLADGIAEGEYRAEVRGSTCSAKCTLRVEEIRLPPFEVEVEPGRDVFERGETVFGTVRARSLTGEPIGGVRGECRWRHGESVGLRLRADGSEEFRIEPPARPSVEEPLTVRVVHGGLWVDRQVRVAFAGASEEAQPAPERRIEAPAVVRVGGTLPVRAHLDGEDGPVLLDILAAHGLLAARSGELRDGVAAFEVEMPDASRGRCISSRGVPEGKTWNIPSPSPTRST